MTVQLSATKDLRNMANVLEI